MKVILYQYKNMSLSNWWQFSLSYHIKVNTVILYKVSKLLCISNKNYMHVTIVDKSTDINGLHYQNYLCTARNLSTFNGNFFYEMNFCPKDWMEKSHLQEKNSSCTVLLCQSRTITKLRIEHYSCWHLQSLNSICRAKWEVCLLKRVWLYDVHLRFKNFPANIMYQ